LISADKLNLPESVLTFTEDENGIRVFDRFRKRYVRLTPEEWVRQQLLNYLVDHLGYPASLMKVESSLTYNGMEKRADAIVYKGITPKMVIECKAASVPLSQATFDQIARYNFSMRVDYLLVSNGLRHFCCKMDYTHNTYHFLNQIPTYEEL
jgi:predicted type IV restriction endonuclease